MTRSQKNGRASAPGWRWPLQGLLRWLALCGLGGLLLQVVFALRIASMNWIDPQSTTFQRSEAARLLRERGEIRWSQRWVDLPEISKHLQRAVIASEDAGFVDHFGVDWKSIESAWDRNQKAQDRVEQRTKRLESKNPEAAAKLKASAKVVGGSTITQQLAKNLFLSGERHLARKAQEMVLTWTLEALLSKRRILEIYLNSVEWGEGLFGAQAAARHYAQVDAARLGPDPAARLAVMLPAPKRFEKNPQSAYVLSRSETILYRMNGVQLP